MPRPAQIFALAGNYANHTTELTGEREVVRGWPMVFTKFTSSLTGPVDEIELPSGVVDWEVELVVVIGRLAHGVPAERAWDFVAGLTVGQDFSERAIQYRGRSSHLAMAKSLPGFSPIGPFLVTPDSLEDPDDLAIGCDLDGEPVQSGRTGQLLYSVPELIATISALVPMLPGDLVFHRHSGRRRGCAEPDALPGAGAGAGQPHRRHRRDAAHVPRRHRRRGPAVIGTSRSSRKALEHSPPGYKLLRSHADRGHADNETEEREVIWGLGHGAFTVTDLEASVEFATTMLGLREIERRDGTVFLADRKAEPSLELRAGDVTALDHFALVTTGPETVEQVRSRVLEAGIDVSDSPEEPYIERSIRFRAPSGHVIDVYCASTDLPAWDPVGRPPYVPSGVQPLAPQHITLTSDDRDAFVDFMVGVLGFMISDHVAGPDGNPAITFMRAGSRQHRRRRRWRRQRHAPLRVPGRVGLRHRADGRPAASRRPSLQLGAQPAPPRRTTSPPTSWSRRASASSTSPRSR